MKVILWFKLNTSEIKLNTMPLPYHDMHLIMLKCN